MFGQVLELLYTGVKSVFGWFDLTLVAAGALSSVFGLILFIAAWRIFIQPLFGNMGSALHGGVSSAVSYGSSTERTSYRTNSDSYFED